jgi:hypothetical protein
LATCRTKTTITAARARKFIDFDKGCSFYLLEYKLCDSITAFKGHALAGIVIDHDALQLASESGIDCARSVDHSHAMFNCEPGTRVDKGYITIGQGD